MFKKLRKDPDKINKVSIRNKEIPFDIDAVARAFLEEMEILEHKHGKIGAPF